MNVMPERLLSVISGILAGGIHGFRFELCCFSPSYLAPFCVSVFSLFCFFFGGHSQMTHKMSSCMLFPLLVAIPLLCVLFVIGPSPALLRLSTNRRPCMIKRKICIFSCRLHLRFPSVVARSSSDKGSWTASPAPSGPAR